MLLMLTETPALRNVIIIGIIHTDFMLSGYRGDNQNSKI